ncbi:MAG: hypothetical protein M9899_10040 [Bdellovibrionaceae bacterium]|nr:hypothetical protein [Pseudobdellovibrionaceae bacterium]
MKNLKLILIALLTVSVLTACDDGGNGGSSSEHSDIKKAKQLVKKFETSNVIVKGYIRPQNSYDVIRTLSMHGINTAQSFYQMHEIGCIKTDGELQLTLDKEINTASLIVGTVHSNKNKEKATYVQTNKPDSCYMGASRLTVGFGPYAHSRDWKWKKISNCNTLVTHAALKRVDKEQINQYSYSSLTPPNYPAYNSFDVDYWSTPRWSPYRPNIEREDSYFLLQSRGTRYYGPAKNDHFASFHDRAVFVSETVSLANVSSGCAKTVYYGRAMSPQGPVVSANIQIQLIP